MWIPWWYAQEASLSWIQLVSLQLLQQLHAWKERNSLEDSANRMAIIGMMEREGIVGFFFSFWWVKRVLFMNILEIVLRFAPCLLLLWASCPQRTLLGLVDFICFWFWGLFWVVGSLPLEWWWAHLSHASWSFKQVKHNQKHLHQISSTVEIFFFFFFFFWWPWWWW